MTADLLSFQCNFDSYLFSRHRVVIASSAFGLGVDIEDIRGVVFLQPPATTSELVQQIGRGGWDGGLCEVHVPYNNLERGKAKQELKDLLMAQCKRVSFSLHLINDVYSVAHWNNYQKIMSTYRSCVGIISYYLVCMMTINGLKKYISSYDAGNTTV